MIPYGLIVWIALPYLWIRMWRLHGPKIPVLSLALIAAAFFIFPRVGTPNIAFPLFVIAVEIALLLIDKFKSATPLGK